MTPFEFGCTLGGIEKQALHPILTQLWGGVKNLGKGAKGIDDAAGVLLRGLASGTRGIGKLFGAAGDLAAPVGRGVFNASTTMAENKIKNQTLSDALKALGYTGRMAGKAFETSGGGAGLVNKGLHWTGNKLDDISRIGYGLPTATALGIGGGAHAAGILQNPVRIAPQGDHIDVRSPVTAPVAVQNWWNGEPQRRLSKYDRMGRRRR